MPPHPVCRPLFPACVQPEMSEVLKVRDAVLLLAANKGRQGVHEKKGLQQQMNSNLNNIQVSGDEEVRAALMQLLNDQSEAMGWTYGRSYLHHVDFLSTALESIAFLSMS
eukprot:scaffold78224_cov19-Tisochrysis_lutea.AAC.2